MDSQTKSILKKVRSIQACNVCFDAHKRYGPAVASWHALGNAGDDRRKCDECMERVLDAFRLEILTKAARKIAGFPAHVSKDMAVRELCQMAPGKSLSGARKEIEDIIKAGGPYTHNLVSLILRGIAELHGQEEADKLIKECNLTKLCGIEPT